MTDREIQLTVTLSDVLLIRKALDAYQTKDEKELAIQRDLVTWLHTDFE